MLIKLTEMDLNNAGIIKSINGGKNMEDKLNAIGIRIDQKITKVTGVFMQGPVVIRIHHKMEVAIGNGMASKIMIEINN